MKKLAQDAFGSEREEEEEEEKRKKEGGKRRRGRRRRKRFWVKGQFLRLVRIRR